MSTALSNEEILVKYLAAIKARGGKVTIPELQRAESFDSKRRDKILGQAARDKLVDFKEDYSGKYPVRYILLLTAGYDLIKRQDDVASEEKQSPSEQLISFAPPTQVSTVVEAEWQECEKPALPCIEPQEQSIVAETTVEERVESKPLKAPPILSEEQIAELREAYRTEPRPIRSIARAFGISIGSVYRFCSGVEREVSPRSKPAQIQTIQPRTIFPEEPQPSPNISALSEAIEGLTCLLPDYWTLGEARQLVADLQQATKTMALRVAAKLRA